MLVFIHFAQIVEELLAAGAKLDPLVFDSYLLPLHMAINKVPSLPAAFLEQIHTCTCHICPKLAVLVFGRLPTFNKPFNCLRGPRPFIFLLTSLTQNHTAIAKLLIEKGAKLDEKSYVSTTVEMMMLIHI